MSDDPMVAVKIAVKRREERREALYAIEHAEQSIEHLQDQYLKLWGWGQTCDTPGSLWLWGRDFSNEDKLEVMKHDNFMKRVTADGREYKGSAKPLKTGSMLVDKSTALAITQRYLEEMYNVS